MYILIQDEKIKINGQVFEAIDETPTHYVINQDGIKTWISRDNVRLMPEDYKPGIPEAFDAEDSMSVPNRIFIEVDKVRSLMEYDGWGEDPRTIAMAKENDEIRARLKALKMRMDRKSDSNIRLSTEMDFMAKVIKELERDQSALIQDNKKLKEIIEVKAEKNERAEKTVVVLMKNVEELTAERDEYKNLNDFHRKEVEKGNERREKIKKTVEALHDEIRLERKARQEESIRANEASEQLNRANAVIDYFIGK